MKPLHVALALLVVLIWGFNFVVIKVGLSELPPVFMTAARFLFAALPAVFFVRPPRVPARLVVLYGLFMFALQFAALFAGMYLGMPAGLASLVIQFHVFLTIAMSAVLFGERLDAVKLSGIALAVAGLALVAANTGGDVPAWSLGLVLLAALSWAIANIVSKKIGSVDILALVVWGSLVAPLPLLVLSLAVEGQARIADSLAHLSWLGIGAVAYIVYPTTLLCFSIWSWLLNRYPASTVTPFTLLVPVVGFVSASLVLGEPLEDWKLWAAALVVGGLVVCVLGPRIRTARGADATARTPRVRTGS